MAMKLESHAFAPGSPIPARFTGRGDNLSPPLSWNGVPPGTREFAVICTDPDAPGTRPWVHWVACKISPVRRELPEGVQEGIVQGKNDFGRLGYGGPNPPRGHGTHHYHFRIYALDKPLEARPGITQDEAMRAMKGHILAEDDLVGTFEIS